MIKVLIVDDSRVVQQFLTHLLSSDPEFQVIGVASTGNEAIKLVNEKRPDLITMDIHMPGMDGYEATRVIMETIPTPIVIVSGSLGANDVKNYFKLLESGALAIVLRPPGIEDPGLIGTRKELIQTLKLMSEVKVIRRFPKQSKENIRLPRTISPTIPEVKDIQLIAIGASTGGPIVLETILSHLPKDLPVPVLIVQHIAKGFINGYRDWLASTSTIPLFVAQHGEILKPGNGYIAPDDLQMGILPGPKISLSKLPAENSLCPSVDFLFRSVAEVMGSQAIGVLLTGMGKDGAKGLKTMKDSGAITIVQDEASCVIFGMPGEAVRIGAADQILPPEKIVEFITDLFNENNSDKS
jgi:two-component system chemotaxis response regulator CheB